MASAFLLVYATLFPIVNPIGNAPIFFSLTRGSTRYERNALALEVARNGFLLLVASLFVGSHVLEFFGLTLPAVRVAGGLVISVLGWHLLHAEEPIQRRAADAVRDHASGPDAFYPLTMPLTVGPGSISVAIALGSQRPAAADLGHLAQLGAAAVAGLLAIAATVYVAYRLSETANTIFGERVTNVVVRLSAFILLCIGLQIIWNGYQGLTGTGT